MGAIWGDKARYLLWLKVEFAVSEVQARLGYIPRKDWLELKKNVQKLISEGGVEPARVDYFEEQTRHDLIAFTTAVAERVGKTSRFIHFGLTSSDVVDSALSIQILQASQILQKSLLGLIKVLKKKSKEHKGLATIGRSHGIFAEPTSFGLKFLSWAKEAERNLKRIQVATQEMGFGKVSGAVGVSPHWSLEVEEKILSSLGLKREPVSTQVVPRDRHAQMIFQLALLGSSLERIAIELRHLQRSEVGEVYEGFSKGQKGSSAMPHKRNPISSENLTGIARLLRGFSQSALENVALWHERDISHSAVERVIFPDAFILADYALDRLTRVLENLEIRKDRVSKNLKDAGSMAFSGHILLALVQAGAPREEAYYWVQECALKPGADFLKQALTHPKIGEFLSRKEIQKRGSVSYQLRHVNQIFKKS